MTPSPPDEAIHFRGKTLTPESPRPQRAAEPANIPLLQNQMDPVFNDASTFEGPESVEESPQSQDEPILDGSRSHGVAGTTASGNVSGGHAAALGAGSLHAASLQASGSTDQNDTAFSTAATSYFPLSQPSLSATETLSNWAAGQAAYQAGSQPEHAALVSQAAPGPAGQAAPVTLSSPFTLPQRLSGAEDKDGAAGPNTAPRDPIDNRTAAGDDTTQSANGVDLQNLLDNLSRSSQSAAITAPSSTDLHGFQSTDDGRGLPPRPPTQENAPTLPTPTYGNEPHDYHPMPPSFPNAYGFSTSPQSSYRSDSGPAHTTMAGPPGAVPAPNALPPPPVASFQQPPTHAATWDELQPRYEPEYREGLVEPLLRRQGRVLADEDTPWGPEVQKKYDAFLHDERVYVTEGYWDRFPPGSRLFIGNLPTERVTKRDLFHIFHQFGKLAQISIKQAYGFIQFVDSHACHAALQAEQGAVVRGRKIHLEISKPQKNTRQEAGRGDAQRAAHTRRSRSPDHRRNVPGPRNARFQRDRHNRPHEAGRGTFTEYHDDQSHRRRDDYRSQRSPSPRGFRPREEFRSRDRSPGRFDRRERRRSRSPYDRDRRFRSPSPRARGGRDINPDISIPRRAPGDIPDVEILVVEEVDRGFISHVESSFRNRGLRTNVSTLNPRTSLSAVVQRHISDGVLAVVTLSRANQYSGKIVLRLLDKAGGPDGRPFEYPELDVNIAVEVIIQAVSTRRGGNRAQYPTNPQFAIPQMAPIQAHPQPALAGLSQSPSVANLITSMDGPALQSLLSALQQPQTSPQTIQQQPFPSVNPGHVPDLASLLNSVTHQTRPVPPPPPSQPSFQPGIYSQNFALQAANPTMVPDPNLANLLAKGLGNQQSHGQSAASAPNIQNLMNQLGRWRQ